MSVFFEWMGLLPILLSAVSFVKFVRDANKEHSADYKPKIWISRLFVILGLIGLVGSVLSVAANIKSSDERNRAQRTLIEDVSSLRKDNVALEQGQERLVSINKQLNTLTDNLRQIVKDQSDDIRALRETVSDTDDRAYRLEIAADEAKAQAAETNRIAQQQENERKQQARHERTCAMYRGFGWDRGTLGAAGC